MSDSLLTIKESAAYLKVHWQSVRTYIKNGTLPYSKIGKNIRIKKSDLDNFISGKKQIKSFEVDTWYKVADIKDIQGKLLNLNAKVTYSANIIDHWFCPLNVSSLKENSVFYENSKGFGLRIRELSNDLLGSKVSIDVKKQTEEGGYHDHRVVFETNMSVSSYNSAKALLKAMGQKEFCTVYRDRTMYQLNGLKISVENIKELGMFIDIGITRISETEGIKEINNLANKLNLKESQKLDKSIGYLAIQKMSHF